METLPENEPESKPGQTEPGQTEAETEAARWRPWKPWETQRPLAGGGTAWVVNWHELQPGGGRIWKRRQFKDRAKLDKWFKREKTRRTRLYELSHRSEQRGDAVSWWVRIAPPDRSAIMRAVELMRVKGGRLDGMVEAVELYAATHLTGAKLTLAEVVNEHLERLAKIKRPGTVIDRRSRLNTFVAAYGDTLAAAITPATVEDWVLSTNRQPLQAARRRAVNALFTFAARRGYVPENPVARVEKIASRSPDEVAVFSPGEVEAVLRAAQKVEPRMVPFFALGFFAGLRPQNELGKLDFANVNLEPGGKIKVVRSTSKTDRTRYVPIQPNLRAWLRSVPAARRTGPVPYSRRAFRRVLDAARVDRKGRPVDFTVEKGKPVFKAGKEGVAVKWSADVMRHTFCTYRQAVIRNIHQLCEEAGNTPHVARAHYLEPKENAEAEAALFWSIKPTATTKASKA